MATAARWSDFLIKLESHDNKEWLDWLDSDDYEEWLESFGMDDYEGHPQEEFRFLLLGKTGSGKSSTGNTILGQNLFCQKKAFSSVTDKCQLRSATTHGATIKVMDTPALFDTKMTHEEVSKIMLEAFVSMHPGPDAIFYVIKIDRYTPEEFDVYNWMKSVLDDKVTSHMILIFTHGDGLEEDIGSVLSNGPETLRQVLDECGQRYAVFDNMDKRKTTSPQVKNLLQTVRKLRTKNGNKPYSCPKYAFVAKTIEMELWEIVQQVKATERQNKQDAQKLKQELAMVKEKNEYRTYTEIQNVMSLQKKLIKLNDQFQASFIQEKQREKVNEWIKRQIEMLNQVIDTLKESLKAKKPKQPEPKDKKCAIL